MRRPSWAIFALVLIGCTSPAMDPDLTLHDRFVLTALTNDDGSPIERLWKWRDPILLYYDGPNEYHDAVHQQAAQLSTITGHPFEVAPYPVANLYVEISDRDTPNTCQVVLFGPPTRYHAEVHIWSELTDRHIRSCIAQEMAQAMGPGGDLDGPFGSRSDTVFASYGGADGLTPQDIAVLRILFDDRLRPGMPRDEVLAILPEIVADVEAAHSLVAQ